MKPTLLITGGTGFLGRHLAIEFRDTHRVVLAGRNQKQAMHARSVTECEVVPMDVSSIHSVRDALAEFRPSVVVHAAATKFVDLAERQPMECVDVNVLGSSNVARASIDAGVEIVLAISTDKAAPPVRGVYGLSKALMERMFAGMQGKTDTGFACVRYGNVAWSTGSVLPVWKRMMESEGKITSTGPEMTRFFFRVEEAVGLIRTALEHSDVVAGNILSAPMKSARISRMLDVWTRELGGSWETGERRPADRADEYLIGEAELEYTSTVSLSGREHFLITPAKTVEKPLASVVTSATVEPLSDEDILDLITSPPAPDLL